MVEISSLSVAAAAAAAAAQSVTAPAGRKSNAPPPPDREIPDREIHDTVRLSGGGQKIVNLARGNELAEEILSKPVDGDFVKFLAEAMKDINRITRLFGETFKTLFRLRR